MDRLLRRILSYSVVVLTMLALSGAAITCRAVRLGDLRYVSTGAAALGVGICGYFMTGLTYYSTKARERRKARARHMQEGIKPPDLSKADPTQTILTIKWSIGIKQYRLLSLRWLQLQRSTWVWLFGYGLYSAICGAFAFGRSNIPAITLSFWVGIAIYAYGMYNWIQWSVGLLERVGASIFQTALAIEVAGIREIVGSTTRLTNWTDVQRASCNGGIVVITRLEQPYLIPDYAFGSREDAKAFVATIICLKNGLKLPVYDWSGYSFASHSIEGVWPPPISAGSTGPDVRTLE